ncbi:hypothetical protein Bbelb_201060 [Branchiostoma belcheri]|nr:hypothetical protein Bbelb_201060 [Branchiostoma belcheri]
MFVAAEQRKKESALETVRRSSARPNPPVSELGMPLEMEYADDVDFLDEEKAPLERLLPVAARNLKDLNLFGNEGLQWPRSRVTNDTLYKVCNTEPLSVKVEKLRWSLFGHILRMPQDTTAQKALEF